ncbi:EF-hand domain-containing protein D1 [Intoshia linei]|uniref:EF-hand domain-containing protein D1 n=1 Tax=Intoshia linei TaxID=1819745 RepID=A0A177B1E9_9BILA|nr:EF-hand domain-containing protein D1 [Intoshia linei]
MASNELASKLNKRCELIDAHEEGYESPLVTDKLDNVYSKFPHFTRKELNKYQLSFKKVDMDKDNKLNMHELKLLMESLEMPQTHLNIKGLMKKIDEDMDNHVSLYEFLMIFEKVRMGEVDKDSTLYSIYSQITSIDVDEEGVKGAKGFFESKINDQSKKKAMEDEIKEEQLEKKKAAEEKAESRRRFKEKANMFKN